MTDCMWCLNGLHVCSKCGAPVEHDRDLCGECSPRDSALCLTKEEWTDLAEICEHYLGEFPTPSSLGLDAPPGGEERWATIDRRRALARRVVDASGP